VEDEGKRGLRVRWKLGFEGKKEGGETKRRKRKVVLREVVEGTKGRGELEDLSDVSWKGGDGEMWEL